jgi:hypothetical protein
MGFDPYREWLNVPESRRPPTPHDLLGLAPGETDPERIRRAAVERYEYVRAYTLGPHRDEANRVLVELAHAMRSLLASQTEARTLDEMIVAWLGPPPATEPTSPGVPLHLDAGQGGPRRPETTPHAGSGSPFARSVLLSGYSYGPEKRVPSPESVGASETGAGEETGYALDSELRAYATARVTAPATSLIVAGALGLAMHTLGTLLSLSNWQEPPDPDLPEPEAAIYYAVGALLSAVVTVGSWRMKKLQGYGLATTSAILAMLPFTYTCCFFGFPFGIWALVVLSDSRVKDAFRSPRPE